jgi:RNA polymerase sigma-70 factor, ECF subfamily
LNRREDSVEDRPDNLLVEQAMQGDGESFTELCRRYYGPLVAIGHAILGDRHLAEDAAQEAFAKAAVHLPTLRRADQFGSWLAAICRNEARDLCRIRQQSQREEQAAQKDVPPTERDDAGEAVRVALKELPEESREVVFLRYYDGLSYDQISAALGISEQAINGRLRRAKRKLAELLCRHGFDQVEL